MTDRFAAVDAEARRAFGGEPVWRFFVPGRLEVFGKHTDYLGGRTLIGAVPRGFAVAVLPSQDRRVILLDAASGNRFDCSVDAPGPATARWHGYVLAVIRRLARNFPTAELSMRVVFTSDLPPAAGISSSSALLIAVAEAVIARAGLEATDAWQRAIRTIEDRAAYFGCIENGSSFGPLAGDDGVGTLGGSEDHAGIVASREGCLQQYLFTPLRLERRIPMPPDWTFVVATTGVRASKTGGARQSYNRLAESASAILSHWRTSHPDDERTLGELAREGMLDPARFPAPLRPRLEHFLGEDARVTAAADAFSAGAVDTVGVLADASQREAARLLGNQAPETIDLVSAARDLGAAAACGFGAGWGGSVWALVPSTGAETFLDGWLRAYRARHPHRAAEGFVAYPSNGLLRL